METVFHFQNVILVPAHPGVKLPIVDTHPDIAILHNLEVFLPLNVEAVGGFELLACSLVGKC